MSGTIRSLLSRVKRLGQLPAFAAGVWRKHRIIVPGRNGEPGATMFYDVTPREPGAPMIEIPTHDDRWQNPDGSMMTEAQREAWLRSNDGRSDEHS